MNSVSSKAAITAIGTYVPDKRLTNADLEKLVETSDEWIVQRTGMRERRISAEQEFTSDLCIRAVDDLIRTYGKHVEDVDLIIVATTTPDYPFPSVACLIQEHFNIQSTGAFDLNATCAGFAYGLHVANGLISAGLHRKVLVVGGETLSKVTDYTDRTTCILFGDGAGAVLVEADETNPGFIASIQGTDGSGGMHLYRAGMANALHGLPLAGAGNIVQNGREVYKWAVRTVTAGIEELLPRAGMTIADIDWFVPHSVNLRMIESICEKTGIPIDKTLYSVEYMGNTSAASIPLSLGLGVREEKLKYGDTLLLYGFGGGLTHAGLVVRWGAQRPPQ
ncbi:MULTISPECIES: ketoacyl-ACP synthase III [Paenibacillus]|uniref:Beta-ketoacyl-[acyl-carrier-protein] synthase III n=1 Tax=Paenibacillus albilobatus TaxID=2716884 RepID=A0A919XKZ6_9BACL|nr:MULTISPECIES: ketoacyl-ACP synthase III [Paenibacillus]GIO33323.1 3-oxoacyl-[acyl-carrier-protein] synthase 3 protein 2 [Paenibacillus albilobatus]